jgi:hypothetical protein
LVRKIEAADLAELNKDFAGKPDEFAELLEAAPENEKATKAREELARWHKFLGQPWTPPETLAAAIDELDGDEPAIWLNAAVDLMAFGIDPPPAADGVECGARRLQASKELCEGARLGKFKLIAGNEGHEIKRSKFDLGLRLGATKDTLEMDRASSRCESDLEFDRPFECLELVRAEPAAEFVAWLRKCCGAPQLEKQSSQPAPVKRGRKFKYDWKEGKLFFDKLMAAMGDLDDRQEWCAQADIERKVIEHMRQHGGGEPTSSLVQDHVKQWLTDFRATNTQ